MRENYALQFMYKWRKAETYRRESVTLKKTIFLVRFRCLSCVNELLPLQLLPMATYLNLMGKCLALILINIQFRDIYFSSTYSKH